jgi:hypothetical protein
MSVLARVREISAVYIGLYLSSEHLRLALRSIFFDGGLVLGDALLVPLKVHCDQLQRLDCQSLIPEACGARRAVHGVQCSEQ